jgi:hypothetical protein
MMIQLDRNRALKFGSILQRRRRTVSYCKFMAPIVVTATLWATVLL